MAVPGLDPGIVPAIHVFLVEGPQETGSASGSSQFPENRENNREFVVFSTIAIVDAKSLSN
jgi:hypothetical protein